MKNASLIIAAGAAVSMASTAALGARVDRTLSSTNVKTTTTSNVSGSTFDATDRVGELYIFDVTGIESHNGPGDPANTVVSLDLASLLGFGAGTPIALTGLGWDVNITGGGSTNPAIANAASWLSELAIGFDNSSQDSPDAVSLAPGAGNDAPGTGDFLNAGIKLSSVPLNDIVLPDGIITLEFFEGYDDGPGVDGIWNSGIIYLQADLIPTPGAAAILGLGGLAMTRRRR